MTDIRRLPDSELAVMQALWRCGGLAVRSGIEEKMEGGAALAATTLLTLLARLQDKGFVKAEKNGRSSVYTALVAEQDYLAAQSRRFFDRLCGGKPEVFAAALCGSGISREDIEELRELLERREL